MERRKENGQPRRLTIGTLDALSVELIAVGPGGAAVDIAIACMFEHEMRGKLSGGLLHLDETLGGALSALRADGTFRGRAGDTLLLTQLPVHLISKAVLIVSLGLPETFSVDVLHDAIANAAQQILRMPLQSASFSPNLLDAGFHPEEVSGIEWALLHGLKSGLDAEDRLVRLGYRSPTNLRVWLFQAGEIHFEAVAASFSAGLLELIQSQGTN